MPNARGTLVNEDLVSPSCFNHGVASPPSSTSARTRPLFPFLITRFTPFVSTYMDTGCTIVVERMLRSSTLLRGLASKAAGAGKKPTVVFVDGARIPFAQSSTVYNDYLGVDLQKFAYKGLVDKTALDPKEIDYILGGNGKPEARGGGRSCWPVHSKIKPSQ